MNRTLLKASVLLTGSLLMASCQQNPFYTVEGRIDHYEGRILLLSRNVSQQWDTLGNMVSVDGSFSFTGEVAEPRVAEVFPVNARFRVPVFLEEGRFQVKADARNVRDYTVSGGGELQRIRSEFAREEARIDMKRDSLLRIYEKEYDMSQHWARIQVRGLLSVVDTLYEKAEDEFIRKNDNMVSANLIMQRFKSLYSSKKLHRKYALLGEKAKNTPEGLYMKPLVEEELRIIVGGTAPDLQMETPEGKKKSLYDVKAKLKILDFWASWCNPCRQENPNVRKIYSKYKDKGLEVVSVSFDVDREKWIRAIKEDNLPWVHISDLKGWNSKGASLYRISGIPRLFILDEDNRILAEGLRGEELEQFVGAYFR